MSSQKGSVTTRESETTASRSRPERPTTQELFDVLSNRRRRYALHALSRDGATDIGSLAELIAAWENDRPVAEVTSAERKRVYTALQQSHLPKLERTGLVAFDPESGRVTPTAVAHDLDLRLGTEDDGSVRWSRYYLGLSGVSAVIAAGVWAGVPPFSALPTAAWLTVVVSLFGGAALVHDRREARDGASDELPEVP